MNTLAKLDRIADTLTNIVESDNGLELEISKKRIKSLQRISTQIKELVADQRADLVAEAEAAKAAELAARQEAIDYVTAVAEEHGLTIKVMAKPPKTKHPKVEATAAEIRAWAEANDVPVNPKGILPKRVLAAFEEAHA